MNGVQKISIPNLILVSGNGRNSGKTLFARNLIQNISKKNVVTGVKISPHIHWVDSKSILLKKEHFTICEELEITSKDSSLMLQAGAERVFFMMSKQEHLPEAFTNLKYLLPQSIIICESGGLYEIIKPGLHFFVMEKGSEFEKNIPQNTKPIVVQRDADSFNFDIINIQFSKNKNVFLLQT